MEIKIVKFRTDYASAFASLNLYWLKENDFEITEKDMAVLENPEINVIKQGGKILFALAGNTPIGTIALIPNDSGMELAKLGVHPAYRGLGIATQLVKNALLEAKNLGYQEVHLYTNKGKLPAAFALYQKLGFSVAKTNSESPRCETKMIGTTQ